MDISFETRHKLQYFPLTLLFIQMFIQQKAIVLGVNENLN